MDFLRASKYGVLSAGFSAAPLVNEYIGDPGAPSSIESLFLIAPGLVFGVGVALFIHRCRNIPSWMERVDASVFWLACCGAFAWPAALIASTIGVDFKLNTELYDLLAIKSGILASLVGAAPVFCWFAYRAYFYWNNYLLIAGITLLVSVASILIYVLTKEFPIYVFDFFTTTVGAKTYSNARLIWLFLLWHMAVYLGVAALCSHRVVVSQSNRAQIE